MSIGDMSLSEALAGTKAPPEIRDALEIVSITYMSFDEAAREGQLVVHEELTAEVRDIFAELFELRFPIAKMVPIVQYGWDDDASMNDNNTSAFNYRVIAGTDQLSNHSTGRAIDINPRINPYVRDDYVAPANVVYDPGRLGAITPEIATVFTSRGWVWGGSWTDRKDWQHFEKRA